MNLESSKVKRGKKIKTKKPTRTKQSMFTVPKMERPAGTHIQKKLEVTGLEEKKKSLKNTMV